MRYVQDWAPLAEARRMVESSGLSKDEAELDICNALADRKISIRSEVIEVYGSRAGSLSPHRLAGSTTTKLRKTSIGKNR